MSCTKNSYGMSKHSCRDSFCHVIIDWSGDTVVIGASLSEPHIDEFAVNFLYIYIYVSYVVP